MILHIPWSRNLGGARVQLELAEEFEKSGHTVEKFDYHDAFPKAENTKRWTELVRPSFAYRAKEFVKEHGYKFDVIDAHQGGLPFSKTELNFHGLLVARSVGLYAFYSDFSAKETTKPSKIKLKTRIGNQLRSFRANREYPYYLRSFESCDLINVPNHDEFLYVRDKLNLGHKCTVLPFGLSAQRQKSFFTSFLSASKRLENQTIAFIGSWETRKGSGDWSGIIKNVRLKVPNARFLFLGTGVDSEVVLASLNVGECDWIKTIPHYSSEELPELLSRATIGAFPSYIEGFGFSVLEKLACGLPTVAYDVPGPREMLRHLDSSYLVPVGDINQISRKLIQLLRLEPDVYSNLAEECVDVASKFSWSKIAHETLKRYSSTLEK